MSPRTATHLHRAESAFDASERSTAELGAPGASQESGGCKHRSSSPPAVALPVSDRRSRAIATVWATALSRKEELARFLLKLKPSALLDETSEPQDAHDSASVSRLCPEVSNSDLLQPPVTRENRQHLRQMPCK